jgi:hypothetical protein
MLSHHLDEVERHARVMLLQPTKVDTETIALKVKQEFSRKEKAKKLGKPTPPAAAKTKKAA